jgi:hypothetical protein
LKIEPAHSASRRPPFMKTLGVAPALFGPVAHLRYTVSMKTATIPSVRVEPDFRAEVEAVLADGETLSEFVEASVRASVERRRVQAEFIARGLRSRDEARRTGEYVDADVVLEGLQRKLDAARARVAKKRR